jgi:hypothetical protein
LNGPYGDFQPDPFGYMEFKFTDPVIPVSGLDNQVFQIPFTATGTVHGPYDHGFPAEPCPLPGNLDRYLCYESFTGSGTVQFTVGYISQFAGDTDAYFLKGEVYTFTAAPEPSTMAFCAIAVIVAVCRRRKRT